MLVTDTIINKAAQYFKGRLYQKNTIFSIRKVFVDDFPKNQLTQAAQPDIHGSVQ